MCQSEGTHQIVTMAKISTWHFRGHPRTPPPWLRPCSGLNVSANVISKADGKSKRLANYVKSTFSVVVKMANSDETFRRYSARFVLVLRVSFQGQLA